MSVIELRCNAGAKSIVGCSRDSNSTLVSSRRWTSSSVASHEANLLESAPQGANDAVRVEYAGRAYASPTIARIAILLSFSFDTFQTCLRGALPSPDQVRSYDACIIDGSRSNAFDSDPWIQDLKQFIRDNYERTRFVGMCFGHQPIAEAMEGGWESGLWSQGSLKARSWARLDLRFSLLLSNDRVPNQAQIVGDRCLSLQGHPEFLSSRKHTFIASIVDHILASEDHELEGVAASAVRERIYLPVDDLHVGAKIAGFILGGAKGMTEV
ncbi:hypothetical protein M427DRAFT_155813 [Gonapodya prolifera JEL478]|uniref:Class I glutamine amidotransferase-like protein n=1 Tax=Gonapodya prolifera (strain JEL478) TaxID=1344416 RepID=A0A139AD14_GONPJ|nr:hypothetical protein M427DRAFT_155813 [Gonapodya prolifera JEL478]|eukprot:KXS14716.1 hypothetical protein M427DRAFT_155813 [Gonapodya prolifera JEL478]